MLNTELKIVAKFPVLWIPAILHRPLNVFLIRLEEFYREDETHTHLCLNTLRFLCCFGTALQTDLTVLVSCSQLAKHHTAQQTVLLSYCVFKVGVV